MSNRLPFAEWLDSLTSEEAAKVCAYWLKEERSYSAYVQCRGYWLDKHDILRVADRV